MSRMILAVLLATACVAAGAQAATFYVDPVHGSASGDGSAASPWLTIEQVFADNLIESWDMGAVRKNPGAPVKEGDTILLLSGYHGEIAAEHYFNREPITIAAAEGHTPTLKRIYMAGCSEWTFRGLTISPSFAPVYEKVTLVSFYSRFGIGISREMVVEDCTMYSTLDTSGWSATDWVNACSGINLGYEGKWLVARNNTIMNVRHGILAEAEYSTAEYNRVINFSADGMRVTNHGVVAQYNLIKNCYNVDDNHDDGIQGYLVNSSLTNVKNVVLRGNVIINQEDPNQPFPGPLQGIGCFDGPFKNWLVENNVIMNNHWHGITLYLADGCTIVNNTVFSKWYYDRVTDYQTWIDITAGGDPNIVRNNIAHRITLASGTIESNNVIVNRNDDADAWFADYANFDLRLVFGSPAIDAGVTTDAPVLDADENVRPMGAGQDLGAYEYGSGAALTADAGPDQTVVDDDADGFALVVLDGSASVDLVGSISSYLWSKDGAYLAEGSFAVAVLPVGTHTITLKVYSTTGETATDEVVVTVEDGTARKPGDANGDGAVDINDFVILKNNFGSTDAVWADGDFDENGTVDINDFVILKNNFGS